MLFDSTSKHKQVLIVQHFSNILRFQPHFKLAKQLDVKVRDQWKNDYQELQKPVPMHSIIVSEISASDKIKNLAPTTLEDSLNSTKALQRSIFQVVKIEGEVQDYCQVYNPKTKQTKSAKGVLGSNLVWKVSMLCRDSHQTQKLFRVQLAENSDFFGIKAVNLWQNREARKRIEQTREMITKFNVFVEAVLEKSSAGNLTIKDTKLRI